MNKTNIFKLSKEERKESIDKLLDSFTEDELINELVECGLKIKKEKSMSEEEAIEICEDLVGGNKCRLSTTIHIYDKEARAIETVLQELENSISKQVIEDKKNEAEKQLNILKLEYAKYYNRNGAYPESVVREMKEINGKIDVLKELLEGK